VKIARDNAEKGKIAIRNIRRDAIKEARELEKASEMTEDDLKKFEEEIQELTNRYIEEMDKAFEKKSKEIMDF
jgi:ribosome recycling factor